ncbi:MAG: cysteine hydrolase family protein [Woeseia sp.]
MTANRESKLPALLLVDVQKAFHDPSWGVRNNPDAVKNMARLLNAWRDTRRPVIHVKHNSTSPNSTLRPGLPGNDFMDEVAPRDGEAQFEKSVNSAFIGTTLETYLRCHGIESLVIVGFTTDHCVSTTTRMAGNLGFDVTLVADATATFDRTSADGRHYTAEEIHDIHLASLDGEFCEVKTTAEVLAASVSS